MSGRTMRLGSCAEAHGFIVKTLAEMGGSPLKVEGGLLREECAALFGEWKLARLGPAY